MLFKQVKFADACEMRAYARVKWRFDKAPWWCPSGTDLKLFILKSTPFSRKADRLCHCEERSDAAIFNGAKRHPGTKHGRGERAIFPSAWQQKNPPARPVGLVFLEVFSARIKLRLRSFSHGFCVSCTLYRASGVKSFGGCPRRPKCHSIASAMRRQACPSP